MKQEEERIEIERLLAKLLEGPCRPFPALRQKLDASNERGVYVIYDPAGKVLHVGSTPRAQDGVFQRLSNHLSGKSSFARMYLAGDPSRLRNGCKFQYLAIASGRYRALVEALGIGRLCPDHIGCGPDSETPDAE